MKIKVLNFLLFLLLGNLSFSQISTTNLKAWYIADSVVLTSGFVSQWSDYSGNDFHLVQNTAANRPSQTSNVLAGHSVVSFDGLNDRMTVNFGQTFAQPITIFIVWKINSQIAQYILNGIDANWVDFNYPYAANTSLRAYAGAAGGISVSYSKPMSAFPTVSTLCLNSTSKIYDNGILKGSSAIGTNGLAGITVGARYDNIRFLNGDIAELIIYNTDLDNSERQAIELYLMDKYAADLDLGEDINVLDSFCDTALIIDQSFSEILWSTGETNDTIVVSESGEYFVQAKDIFGRLRYDTINVQFPSVNIPDSQICLGDSVLYNPGLTGSFNYLWSDLTTGNEKYYKEEGDYWLEISDSRGCSVTQNFTIDVDSFPNQIWLGNDTSLCSGNKIMLINGEELCTSFLWTPGSGTDSWQIVTSSGWQKIEAENSNSCIAVDSIYVTIVGTAPVPNFNTANLCLGDLTAFTDNSTPIGDIALWRWVFNETDTVNSQNANWQFTNAGLQNVEFYVESISGCSKDTSFSVIIKDIPQVNFDYNPLCSDLEMLFTPEIEVPVGTMINGFLWTINGEEEGTGQNLSYTFFNPGEFEVSLEVSLDNGCSGNKTEQAEVLSSYPLPLNTSCVSPPNGVTLDAGSINFQWNTDENAFYYKILISSDTLFENIIEISDFITDNFYDTDLSTYSDSVYWKVKAYNPCMQELESETFMMYFFSPAQLGNQIIWCNPKSAVTDGGLVSQWSDLSTNNYDLIQTDVSKRPTSYNPAYSDHSLLRFDGTNDFLSKDFGILYDQPISGFIVWKNNIRKDQNVFNGVTTSSIGFYFPYSTTDKLFLNAGGSISIQYDKIVSEFLCVNSFIVSELTHLYENGQEISSGTNIGTNGFRGITLGANSSQNGKFLNGDIAEIIFYDTVLNDTARKMVERYLHDKYFPPVNLGYDIRVPYGFCDTAITTAYKPWFTDYEWSTGETDSVIHVNRPGIYTVTVTDIFGFTSSDDIKVFYPEVNDFADTIVCYGASVVWDTELEGDYSYEWYGSSELTRAITITDEGQYAAILTDTLGCKYYSDTISFSFDNYEFTASVGPTDTSLCSGNRLMLITNAGETVSYNWNTGSTNPEIVLTESGTYYVTVNNLRGCEATDNINVTITGQVPLPAFSSLGHCVRNAVSFTDESTTPDGIINNWTWRVNGNIVSTQQNPEYTFTEPGTYNVNLSIVTDNNCGDFVSVPVIIYPLPVISFEPEYFCQNVETEFISTSTVNESSVIYNLWNFDSYAISGTPVNYSFTDEGYHNIKLISSSEMSCTDSLTREVFIKPAEQPVYTAGNTCLGEDVYFINTTPYNPVNPGESWTWDFGDGGSSSLSNPQHAYSSAGIFNTVLNIQYANKCVVSTSLPVEVYFNPEATVYPVDACEGIVFSPESEASTLSGNIISYSWNIETETPQTSVLQNPEFMIAGTGSYNMSLSVLTDFGCKTTQTNTIHVHENPLAEFSASRTWGSVPLWIDFTNTGENAETYFWDFGDDEISTEENPYHIFADSGTYTVRLISTSAFGCRDSAAMEIKSIIPVMDVILYNLRTEMNDNYLQTQVYIINNGTLPVNNLEMVLNLGNGKIYREVIEYLAPSQVIDYRFTLEAYIPGGNLPDVICVEAVAPAYEGNTDSDLSNNTVCNTDVENLKVMQPYPNPATDQLTCEFIAAQNQDITVTLINSIGGVVYKNTLTDKEGYTKLLINVKDFVQGVYFLQVTDGNEKHSYKVEVQ